MLKSLLKYECLFFEAEGGGGSGGGGGEGGGTSASLLDTPSTDQQQQQQSAVNPWVANDGAFSPEWTKLLPEEMGERRNALGRFKSVPELAKSYDALQSKFGRGPEAVWVPGADAKPEDISAYRKAIGVPDTIDGYSLKPEKLPEGLVWNDELAKPYAEIAHKHNIPQAAMKELVEMQMRNREMETTATIDLIESRKAEGIKTLKDTFKGDYDKNMDLAKRAAQVAGLPVHSAGMADPQVIIALSRLGSMISEDKLVGPGGGNLGQLTGKALATDIQTNKQNPRYEKYQDGDPATVEYVRSLLKNG